MCGVNAILDFRQQIPDKDALISAMNGDILHRGPDGEGRFFDGPIAMGMRRLSIIDVEGGAQPLFNEDQSLVLVCNGEIYNFLELRAGLEQRGHRFSSHSDVEVILHLYEEKGPACLEDLRGMFAFVLWDRARKRIFAARDRVGIKPLYVFQNAGAIYLASSIRSIMSATNVKTSLNVEAIYQFLLFSYPIDQRRTMIHGIDRILPGEYLLADEAGVRFERYWRPHFGGEAGLSDMQDEDLKDLFQESVDLHLQSDVPVAVLLSGGVDSSAIAACAARSGSNSVVICAGYEGRHSSDERPQALATAKSLRLNPIEVLTSESSFESDFEALVGYCDEPVGDIAAMPQWSLYRRARELGYKVLLSGIGGDELFFGYPKWNQLAQRLRSTAGSESLRRAMIVKALTSHLGSGLGRLTRGGMSASAGSIAPLLEALTSGVPPGPDEISALMFGTYLTQNGCQLADKLGMGVSVEVRVPFLDHRLLEAVFGLPLHRRFAKGTSKPLLKRMAQDLVPAEVLRAPKRGFTPPQPSLLGGLWGGIRMRLLMECWRGLAGWTGKAWSG